MSRFLKQELGVRKLAIALCAALLAVPAAAQNYNRVGGTIFGSDGSTSTRVGNHTFHRDRYGNRVTDTHIGNHTFGSDGLNSSRVGNSRFYDDGTSTNRVGSTTFGPGGRSCTSIGNSAFCN